MTRFLIYEEEFRDPIEHLRSRTNIEYFVCAGGGADYNYHQMVREASSVEITSEVDGSDPAMILFSSGTTGKPKGVCHTHHALAWNCVNLKDNFGWNQDDSFFTPTPLFHSAALNRSITALYCGATQVIIRHFSPELYLKLIETERVTVTGLVATMFTMLKQLPTAEQYDIDSVREITMGAAATPLPLLKQVCAFFPKAKVWNAYGLTECPSVTAMRIDDFPAQMSGAGKPLINMEVKIVDEQKHTLPPDEIGEICLRGPTLMKEYFNDLESTSEILQDDWLHTGDIGKIDDEGFLYIADRKKDMIISGGENIYSKEVEDVLYMHGCVEDAAVIGVADDLWGETVRAIIKPNPGTNPTSEEIIAFCAERLAGYKKPRSVVFVDDMPKTVSNKILKRELKERYGKN